MCALRNLKALGLQMSIHVRSHRTYAIMVVSDCNYVTIKYASNGEHITKVARSCVEKALRDRGKRNGTL